MGFKKTLEQKIKEQGFKDLDSFVHTLLIKQGMTFTDMIKHIKQVYGINRSPSAIYTALRQHAPDKFDNKYRFNKSRDALAKAKGFKSFRDLLMDFSDRKMNYREIATELELKSPINIKRLEKIYNVKLAANHKTRKAGFVNQARYRHWLEISKRLGYDSVEEALEELQKKDLALKTIADLFGVSTQSLWRRLKRIRKRSDITTA